MHADDATESESLSDAGSLWVHRRREFARVRIGDVLWFEADLYDQLLGSRNRKWLPQIEALLNADHNVLVLVGTLHFVGHDGLLELLKRAGYKPVPLPAGGSGNQPH